MRELFWLAAALALGPSAASSTAAASSRLYHTYRNPSVWPEPVSLAYLVEEPRPVPSVKSPVLCIHGFGGNADQWRYNLPALRDAGHKAYALDLLGYGYSDKVNPKLKPVNTVYNFENWGGMAADFIENTIKEPTWLVCNSVGGCVGLQAAVDKPDLVKGVVLINISLRMLNVKKQSPFIRPIVRLIQDTLRETALGELFFKQVAEKNALRNVLKQAYAGDVSDETVDIILQPGLLPGAAPVFLDFISYSGGPLPEELLAECKRPVRMLWGENDPWEPIDMGRELARNARVDFVPLQGGGHCPMDQIPDKVNRELLRFLSETA